MCSFFDTIMAASIVSQSVQLGSQFEDPIPSGLIYPAAMSASSWWASLYHHPDNWIFLALFSSDGCVYKFGWHTCIAYCLAWEGEEVCEKFVLFLSDISFIPMVLWYWTKLKRQMQGCTSAWPILLWSLKFHRFTPHTSEYLVSAF